MQRAVWRARIVESVFPAWLELARLTFAVLDVLAEVDAFARRYIKTNCLFEVLEWDPTILIIVYPVEQLPNLVLSSDKSPALQQLSKSFDADCIGSCQTPFVEHTLDRIMLAESPLN